MTIILVWNFDRGDIVHRASALRLGACHKGIDAEQDGGNAQDDGNDLGRRKIAFRGAKFLSDIDSRTGAEIHGRSGLRFWAWLRDGSGRWVEKGRLQAWQASAALILYASETAWSTAPLSNQNARRESGPVIGAG